MLLKPISCLRDRNSLTSAPGLEKVILLCIMLLGMAIRTASWWLQGFKGENTGFDAMGRFLLQGDWSAYFSSQRPHQATYAVLFMPKWILDADLATYSFVLHSILACGTIYLVYRIARFLFGAVCGLLSALLVAVDLLIAFWFPWVTGDVPFHFFLALFALTAIYVWEQVRLANLLVFAFCGVLCVLTRPEGLFVAAVACAMLAFRVLSRYLPLWKILGLVAIGASAGVGVVGTTLYYHKPTREAVFSNIHVAFPLYLSSRPPWGDARDETATFDAMAAFVSRARSQPGFVSSGYALSMEGLRTIWENPLAWPRMYMLRLGPALLPSVFSPWWSARNRLYSFSVSFVLLVGSLLGCVLGRTRRSQAIGLTLMGLVIVFVLSLSHREMDVRVTLSMNVALACVAPFGWLALCERFLKGSISRPLA